MFTNRFDGQAAVAQVLPGFFGAFNLQRQRHTRTPKPHLSSVISLCILMFRFLKKLLPSYLVSL